MTVIMVLIVSYYLWGNSIFHGRYDPTVSLDLVVIYGIIYVLVDLLLLIGLKEARLNEQYNIGSHLQESRDPSHCMFCHQTWDPSDMVFYAWGTSKGPINLGPLCPQCWENLRREFPPKTGLSGIFLASVIAIQLAVVVLLVVFISPDAGGYAYAGLGCCTSLLGSLLIIAKRGSIEGDHRTYQPPPDAHPREREPDSGVPVPMCTYHPHIRAIASCPVCGDRFCNLCVLFPNLKFALPRATVQQMVFRSQAARQQSDSPIEILPYVILMQATATQLPESNMNDPTTRSQFEYLRSHVPERFQELYTPAVDMMVKRILSNNEPLALDHNPIILSCLMHNARRGMRAVAREKSRRGIGFVLLNTVLPLAILIPLLGFTLVFTLVLAIPVILSIPLLLVFFVTRNPVPLGTKRIEEGEEARDELIDQFLLYLDEQIYENHNQSKK